MKRALAVFCLVAASLFTAVGASGQPDRFPHVPVSTSPILAVASVTFERIRPSDKPIWLERIMDALYTSPGLLGAHTAASFERPGMVLIFTWWQNKQALNDFYHSDLHRNWMGAHTGALNRLQTSYFEGAPTPIGIDLFGTLRGGTTVGGGFVPQGVRVK